MLYTIIPHAKFFSAYLPFFHTKSDLWHENQRGQTHVYVCLREREREREYECFPIQSFEQSHKFSRFMLKRPYQYHFLSLAVNNNKKMETQPYEVDNDISII
jgi:hypothetical protein